MNNLDNKGFTLVELLATIVILAIVVGIGSYSIESMVTKSKENELKLLKENIQNAAEVYYQECKYSNNTDTDTDAAIICGDSISLGALVTYGYLNSNSDSDVIVNSNTNNSIENCKISKSSNNNEITVTYNDSDCAKDVIINPKTNKSIGNCVISISSNDKEITVTYSDSYCDGIK